MQKYLIQIFLTITLMTSVTINAINKETVAIIEDTDQISKVYFLEVKDRMKKDPIESYIRKIDMAKNYNIQVLKSITEDYILWKESKKLGYQKKAKFQIRYFSALQGYMGLYLSKYLIKKRIFHSKKNFSNKSLFTYLLKKYKVRIFSNRINNRIIYTKQLKAPELYLYKPLPKVEKISNEKYNKRHAQSLQIVQYQSPDSFQLVHLNLKQIFDRFDTKKFKQFQQSNNLQRNKMIREIISYELLPKEFKRISKNDKTIKEKLRRIEQVTLARYYRIVRGLDRSKLNDLSPRELDEIKVDISQKQMRAYYKKNINKFRHPKTADVLMIRLNRSEVDEGDQFIEKLRAIEKRIYILPEKIHSLSKQRWKLIKKYKREKNKRQQKYFKVKIRKLEDKIKNLNTKAIKVSKEIVATKLDMFKRKMAELNQRKNRLDGKVKLSQSLGRINFSAKGKMKRYEIMAFSLRLDQNTGKESILFSSGEGDYVILFVQNMRTEIPNFKDKMVQTLLKYDLEILLRKKEVRKFLNRRLKQVLKKKSINWKLLRKL